MASGLRRMIGSFVIDRDAHQLLCYSLAGELLLSLLATSERPRFNEPFNHPADVAVASNGAIFVADGYGNRMVHRF